jgi:hypothetical protein
MIADEQITSKMELLVWKGRAEIVIEEYVIQVRMKHRLKVFRDALCSCDLTAMHDWWMDDSDHAVDPECGLDTRWIQVLRPEARREVWEEDKESRNRRFQEDQTATIMAAVNETLEQHMRKIDQRMGQQEMQAVARELVRNSRKKQADKESNVQ